MRMGLSLMLLLLVPTAMVHGQSGLTQSFAASLTAVPTDPQTVAGSVYVPAYSSVAMTPGKMRADFSVTLSLHNASESAPLILKRIAYFDTSGVLVQSYLQEPIALKPFATIEIFIPTKDVRGGTGANFVIDWAATAPIAEPVAEALMIGSLGSGHYAFVSQGRAVRVVGSKAHEP
ncbi:conserved exported hypothetical protein [Bradyrhizobium sp. STM 3843]|nr:DUF3124 domain-containing protein [Bradyrhizobium sp. STM 3843]CCE08948.1 conserved exported hypothetical protein [Bradyrhizobium sp. STM 3843]